MEMQPTIAMDRSTSAETEAEADDPRSSKRARSALTPARQELAMRFVALAKSMARPFMRNWPTFREEFESAAMLALVEAAESYEPGRGVRFATFARYRITGAMRSLQRSIVAARKSCEPGGPAVLPGDLGRIADNGGHILGIAPDPPVGWHHEARDVVDRWLRSLPAHYAEACRLIYLQGRSQVETARILGLSQSRLSGLHRQALEMLHHNCQPAAFESDGVAA